MDLYFSPLACSMATRIAFYEAGVEGRFIGVDTKAKRLADGSDFFAVNAMGQVPVLRTDTGELLTENPVVLQYVADQSPDSGLAPDGGALPAAAVADLHHLGAAQGGVHPAAIAQEQRRRQGIRPRTRRDATGPSECASA